MCGDVSRRADFFFGSADLCATHDVRSSRSCVSPVQHAGRNARIGRRLSGPRAIRVRDQHEPDYCRVRVDPDAEQPLGRYLRRADRRYPTGPLGWSLAHGRPLDSPSTAIYYKIAQAIELPTVIFATTGSGPGHGLMIYEFSGTATSSPLDGVANYNSSTGTLVNSGTTVGTTFANGVVVAGLVTKTGLSFSNPTNGFIEQFDFVGGSGGSATLMGGFYRLHTGNNNNVSSTSTGSDAWEGTIVAFKSSAPTAVKLSSFTATRVGGRVLLQWQTGYEVDNLGFRVYRGSGGQRTRVTPSLVAGSALMVGAGTPLNGQTYAWWDPDVDEDAAYMLEDVNLNGQSTWSSAVTPTAGMSAPAESHSSLLQGLGQSRGILAMGASAPPPTHLSAAFLGTATPSGSLGARLTTQRTLAVGRR